MKILATIFAFIFVTTLFGQSVNYSIEVGGGVNSINETEKENNYASYDPNGYTVIHSFQTTYSSKPKQFFFLNNYFTFPMNNYLSFRTGFGFSYHKLYAKKEFQAQLNNNGFGHSIEPRPGDSLMILDSVVFDQPISSMEENYTLYQMRIPIQLQFNLLENKLHLTSGIALNYLITARVISSVYPKDNNEFNATSSFQNSFVSGNLGVSYTVWENVYLGATYDLTLSDFMKNSNQLKRNSISLNLAYQF